MNFALSGGLTAFDYAEIAENWWVLDYIKKRGARPSGNQQHKPRGSASAQMRHPPVVVREDGSKGEWR